MIMTRRAKQLALKKSNNEKLKKKNTPKGRRKRTTKLRTSKRISKAKTPAKPSLKSRKAQKPRSKYNIDSNLTLSRKTPKTVEKKLNLKEEEQIPTTTSGNKNVTFSPSTNGRSLTADKQEPSNQDKPNLQTNTSISGFLKNLSTESDFVNKGSTGPQSPLLSASENLIDFDLLISAPNFQPSNEPISMFKMLEDGLEIPEEEKAPEVIPEEMKTNLRNVLKKYIPFKEKEEEESDIKVEENAESKTIPEIGKIL